MSVDHPRDLEEREPDEAGEGDPDTLVVPAPDATSIVEETPTVSIVPSPDLDPSDVALDPELVKGQTSEGVEVSVDIAPEALSTALPMSAGSSGVTPPVVHVSADRGGHEVESRRILRQRTFRAVASSVSAARSFATEALADVPADALEVVRLLISELASNAIEHVTTSFQLTVSRTAAEIRVEITDYGAGTPTLKSVGPEAVRGRGLKIVEMLCTQWGVEQESDEAKTVWFTVRLAPLPPA